MSIDLVKYAFIAGEISPTLFGRGDLTKYDLGMAQALNYFVDYRGGLSTRPGTEFCELVRHDQLATKFVRFAFSPDLSNTYVVLFGDEYVRFIQDGGYVLEDAVALTGITRANPGVFTAVAHGLATGDWVKVADVVGMVEVNGRTFEVNTVPTADTFTLKTLPNGNVLNTTTLTACTSGGTISRVYEIVSPYTAADLADLSNSQYRDNIRLTHPLHPIRNLVRSGHTSWALVDEVIALAHTRPVINSHTVRDVGGVQVLFAVTAVFPDGTESIRSPLYRIDNTNNYAIKEGGVKIEFTGVAGASYYNVYRSVITSEEVNEGTELGYVGRSNGGIFSDPNIVADFTKKPPINFNPFAPGAVDYIDVTAGGTGYTTLGVAVSITTSTGSGFIGTAVTNNGAVVGVEVLDHGKGYAPGDTVAFTTGAGATATLHLIDQTGTYPSTAAIFQQRQHYFSSNSKPLTIWGSQPKRFGNFNESDAIIPSDGYELELDAASITPIKHVLISRGGLLLMTQENAYVLSGGTDKTPITPINAFAEQQGYTGVSALRPIPIGSEILFVEGKGYAVRMLSYNEISRVYDGEDRSILSNHLFGPTKELIAWAYQESPYKVVWGVRSDGRLVSFTTVKGEDVYAWTPCETQGLAKDVINVREGRLDRIYLMVARYIGGRWTKMVERLAERTFENVEDAWCVDAGLTNVRETRAATLTIVEDLDAQTANISASLAAFTVDDEGAIIRAAGGKYEVTNYNSTTNVDVDILAAATNFIPQTSVILPPIAEFWDIGQPQTVFGGLWHLEGETVQILGDGNVFTPQVVSSGHVTLSDPVTQVIIGLGYTCIGKSLPTVISGQAAEGRRKRTVGIATRLDRSRGLKVGRALNAVYEMKERVNESLGQPTALFDGIRYTILSTSWTEDNQTYFVQDQPLPATLLGFVLDMEVGDDTD